MISACYSILYIWTTGTTECNLAMGKYNDAMMSAKTALKLKPNSSQAFAIIARVMSKSDTANGRKEVWNQTLSLSSQLILFCVCVTIT